MEPQEAVKKILESRRYSEKKLSYHEAGHLVISYLLGVPCEYIISRMAMSEPKLVHGGISCNIKSEAAVLNILPSSMEEVLNNLQNGVGIQQIALTLTRSSEEVLISVNNYVAIVLAGYESEIHFLGVYEDLEMEMFITQVTNTFAESHQEDVRKVMFVVDKSFKNNSDKNKVISCLKDKVQEALKNSVIDLSIKNIAELAYLAKGTQVYRDRIEEELAKTGLIDNDELQSLRAEISACGLGFQTT